MAAHGTALSAQACIWHSDKPKKAFYSGAQHAGPAGEGSRHPCTLLTHVVDIWLPEHILEEVIGVSQPSAPDNVLVGDEPVAPVQTKHVLTRA